MRIGELARQAGCPVETVRYYEREGLLPLANRSEGNNYRVYDHTHLERLLFIRRCRALDMTQDEIRVLLAALDSPEADCETVNRLLDAHLAHVEARIAELDRLRGQLESLRQACRTASAARDCGILQQLNRAGETPASPAADGAHSHIPGVHHR